MPFALEMIFLSLLEYVVQMDEIDVFQGFGSCFGLL